jgi:DNA polymerase-3 subunit epsilon
MVATQRSFEDLGAPLFEVPFCVLDLETTGGSPADCAITEIGAVRYRGGEVERTFHTLVDPGAPIPPFIVLLTGITQAMVVAAPPVEEVLPSFLEFLGDAVVVGHNVRFDLGFLDAAALRLGYGRIGNRRVDTAALARRLVRTEVRDLRLQTLAAHFRSPVTPIHRALDDARATAHVFWSLLERAGTMGVTALEDLLQLPTARGGAAYHKLALARDLPRRAGVYLFRDRAGTVIYVGKAKNLRTRVSAYFYGDERRSIHQLLRELAEVDYRVCAGELEASITELRLIHAHRPRHNRASRPPKAVHFVTLTDERFPRLSVTRTLHPSAPTVLGPFRSKEAADRVVAALWDALPLRRCAGRPGSRSGRCAPAQLGVALCPCDGSLGEGEYRRVVERAVEGIEREPALLLEPLTARMRELAASRRFEEAAWARDRHRALASALERRRRWQALVAAGRLVLEAADGEHVLVDRGRFVASWGAGPQPLLPEPATASAPSPTPIPPTLAAAEEAHLIWKWMTDRPVRVIEASGPLALPAAPVLELRPAG